MIKKVKPFKKIGDIELYSFDDMLKKDLKSPKFRKAYEEELARLHLVRDIRKARMAKKLTQKQMAKAAGMPQSVVARLESGTHPFSFSTLYRIANVFGKKIVLV
jgi:DNA-binding XRE family transcriptional regulator